MKVHYLQSGDSTEAGAGLLLAGQFQIAGGAAFPFTLPYRLILMHTIAADVVLDPFAGTGTTMAAALASASSSIGVESEGSLATAIGTALRAAPAITQEAILLGKAAEAGSSHQAKSGAEHDRGQIATGPTSSLVGSRLPIRSNCLRNSLGNYSENRSAQAGVTTLPG